MGIQVTSLLGRWTRSHANSLAGALKAAAEHGVTEVRLVVV